MYYTHQYEVPRYNAWLGRGLLLTRLASLLFCLIAEIVTASVQVVPAQPLIPLHFLCERQKQQLV